jgi:hypothetical protein
LTSFSFTFENCALRAGGESQRFPFTINPDKIAQDPPRMSPGRAQDI